MSPSVSKSPQPVKMQGGGGLSKKSTVNHSYQGIKEVDSRLETTQEQTKTPVFNFNIPSPARAFVLSHDMSSVQERSSQKKRYGEMSADLIEVGLPRTSPRVRPEEHPMFDEPSASRVPSKIMTPNNVSSFIELLNYNSETDIDRHEMSKSRLDSSKLHRPYIDTTQEFIKEALADIRATNRKVRTSHSKQTVVSVQPQVRESYQRRGTQLFPNIDDDYKKQIAANTVSVFAGIEFIRPTKHSTRALLPEESPSIAFDELVAMVGSS